MNSRPFYDLNISPDNTDIWKTLCNLNIRTVALNQVLDATVSDNVKKKSGKKEYNVPSPETFVVPKEFSEKFTVIKRLTISLSDGGVFHKIVQSPNFKLFDVIAVIPTNQQTLQFCCASNDIDVICFEPQSRPQWSMSRKFYNNAIQKNIFFELQYGPAISDSTSRKTIIQIAQTYHVMGKSRNIIISSGTGMANLLRSPYDVINFCFLLGFKEKEAKKALTHNPKQLLLRAEYRRHRRSVMNVTMLNNQSDYCPPTSKNVDMDVEE